MLWPCETVGASRARPSRTYKKGECKDREGIAVRRRRLSVRRLPASNKKTVSGAVRHLACANLTTPNYIVSMTLSPSWKPSFGQKATDIFFEALVIISEFVIAIPAHSLPTRLPLACVRHLAFVSFLRPSSLVIRHFEAFHDSLDRPSIAAQPSRCRQECRRE